jgi:protein TonB
MQKGDSAAANRRFEAVTKLLSEPGLAGRADLNDLTMAATAFSELTKAQMTAAATAAAAAAAPPPQPEAPAVSAASSAAAPASTPATAPAAAASTPAAARTASGAQPPPAARPAAGTTLRPPATVVPPGFVPAAAVSQPLPPWQPAPGMMSQLNFTGAVRISIDAEGKVTSAVMDPSVYPPYDRLVLAAARGWTYRPATQDGKPVASERRVEIVLKPR